MYPFSELALSKFYPIAKINGNYISENLFREETHQNFVKYKFQIKPINITELYFTFNIKICVSCCLGEFITVWWQLNAKQELFWTEENQQKIQVPFFVSIVDLYIVVFRVMLFYFSPVGEVPFY